MKDSVYFEILLSVLSTRIIDNNFIFTSMRIFCTYYPSQQHPIETSLINFSTSAKQNKNNIRFMAESIQQNILLSARCLKFSMQYTQLYIISWAHERL